MNRLRIWGLSAVCAAGLGGQAIAGDPNMSPDQTTLIQKLFGPKPAGSSGTTVAVSTRTPLTITAPLTAEVLSKSVQAEQDAYLRRVSVCTELRRVADERGDANLSRQADDLERQAAMIYNARVTALGVPKLKTPLPEPTTAMRLDEPASPRAAAEKLFAPKHTAPEHQYGRNPRGEAMTRMLFGFTLLMAIGFTLSMTIGCTGIQPVGPMAKKNNVLDPKPDPNQPDPVTIPAPTPAPPKCLVHPEDVTAENVDAIKQRLTAEFDADRKSMPSVPVTVETSQYKDGVKQQ